MSEFDELHRLLDHIQGMDIRQRRFGKTYSAVELTKRVGGVLLLHNREFARRVAQEYGVKTDSIQTFRIEGTTAPVIVDQDAFAFECRRLLNEIATLRARLAEVEKENTDCYLKLVDVSAALLKQLQKANAGEARAERLRAAIRAAREILEPELDGRYKTCSGSCIETAREALEALAADSATPVCDSCDQKPCICADVVECPACSRAGGADRAVKHLPPVCKGSATGEQGGEKA